MLTRPLLGAGGLWRWGAPAVAGLGALAAAGSVAGWVWEPTFLGEGIPWLDLAVMAVAFSAMLLACRAIMGPDAPAALPASSATGGRTEALLVTTAIGTGIVLAALQLDGILAHDEATSLGWYVMDQPFAVAAGTYNDTNNHMLSTLLLWVAYQLGGLNPIVLRLPAFLSFCLLLPILWRFVRDEYGPGAALFTTALVGTSTYFVAYATAARGYTMLLLLFATALLCGQRLVHNPRRKRVWAAWAGALGLGGYTIPLMAFPSATTAIWMVLARWRRFGRDGLGSFAARTAAGLAAAAVVAGILYQVSAGMHDVWTTLNRHRNEPEHDLQLLRIAASPHIWWHHWHMGVASWFRGALLALVLVGVVAAGRSCQRRGTLPLALGLFIGLLLLVRILPNSRFMMWALLILLILAGTGASLVVERAAVRAGARWPGIAIARNRRVLQWGVLALVLGAGSWWASRPGIRISHYNPSIRCSTPASWWCLGPLHYYFPPVAALAVVERLRPGDYFTSCWIDRRVAVDIGTALSVDRDVGEYSIATDSEIDWSVHRVSAKEQTDTNDLFVFTSIYGDLPRLRCKEDAPPAPMGALVELRWPDHELVMALEYGQVYALNNWTESP